MRSPWRASATWMRHSVLSRAAKLVVKPGGMCWVMTMAGASAGIGTSTSRIASVPPVEAPMKMIFSVERRGSGAGAAVAAAATGVADAPLWRPTRAQAATRILSTMSPASSLSPLLTPIRGLATKSTAPSSSARSVTSAPCSVRVETITTGIGRSRIRRERNSRPSMRGISTSSVITSGLSSRIISRATSGSAAAPTQTMSFCRLMISVSRLRTSAESSTTTTRVFVIVFSAVSCCVVGSVRTDQPIRRPWS